MSTFAKLSNLCSTSGRNVGNALFKLFLTESSPFFLIFTDHDLVSFHHEFTKRTAIRGRLQFRKSITFRPLFRSESFAAAEAAQPAVVNHGGKAVRFARLLQRKFQKKGRHELAITEHAADTLSCKIFVTRARRTSINCKN